MKSADTVSGHANTSRRLKVLFLATRDWYHPETTGGDSTLWENARYLASSGHSVTYLCSGFGGAPKTELIEGIQVVRFRRIHLLWLDSFVYYMRQCRGRFDVVVAEGFGGSRIPRLAPLYVKEPIVTEWHQIHSALFAAQYPWFLRSPLNLLERITAWVHRNTTVRAGTVEWRHQFPSIGFKPQNIALVPVSIRESWFREVSPSTARQPVIVWLGKYRRYKHPHHVIQAMAHVIKRVPNARLALVGRHDDLVYEAEMEHLVRRLGLTSCVKFEFNVSEQRKHRILSEATVLAVPSAVEGFGIVVLEANACGVPVVASDGVPESVVRSNDNGLRYRTGDVGALADAIATLLIDQRLHSKLSNGARQFAEQFQWQAVGRQFERLVLQVVTGVPVDSPVVGRGSRHDEARTETAPRA